jgi:hypothetical protein
MPDFALGIMIVPVRGARGQWATLDFVIPSAFFLARGICFSNGGSLNAPVKVAHHPSAS